MPLILDNNFTKDTLGLRTQRLILMSANVGDHSVELGLSTELVDWATASKDAWVDALSDSNLQKGERDTAYENYRLIFEEAKEYYQMLKDLLLANLHDVSNNGEFAEQYGVIGRSPRTLGDFYAAVRKFKDANEELTAEGETFVVPEAFVTNLTNKADATADAWEEAKLEKRESKEAYDTQENMYNEDSEKLRVVYQHAALAWGKSNPLVEDLGFAAIIPHHGGATPEAPTGLACDAATNTFSWEETETATSYQLAYRAAGTDDDWEEAYSGADTSVTFDPGEGVWEFKVRARNSHGFGAFSPSITVDLTPVPVPENLRSEVDGSNPNQYDLLWDESEGADSYDLYISRVALGGDPSTFWVDVADATSPTTIEVNASRTEYYKVKAKRGGVESDFSNMIRLDWTA